MGSHSELPLGYLHFQRVCVYAAAGECLFETCKVLTFILKCNANQEEFAQSLQPVCVIELCFVERCRRTPGGDGGNRRK